MPAKGSGTPLDRPSKDTLNVTNRTPQIFNINFSTSLDYNFINVSVHGVNVQTLIDTGASVSCISKSLLQKLQKSCTTKKPVVGKSHFQHARGVGGEILTVQGSVVLDISIGDVIVPHTFFIFDRIHHALILGLDFLQKNHCHIDYQNLTLTSANKQPVVCNLQPNNSSFEISIARATCDVLIPPYSAALVPVKLSRVPDGIPLLIEPVANLSAKCSLAGARSINIPKQKVTVMKILNPMQSSASISKSQVLGKCFPIQSIYNLKDHGDINPNINSLHPTNTSVDDDLYIQKAEELGINLQSSNLNTEQKRRLLIFLGKNADVFSKSSNDIGCTNVYQHRIETGNNPPYRQRPYRQTPAVRQIIEDHVQQMLADGIIVESNSTWSAPVVMVKKRDGSMRFTVDFRGLNARTQPLHFPIPDLQDALDSVGTSGSVIMSVMDLKSSFWQIPLDPETAHKTTFITHNGSYSFTRVPFGVTAGSMCFQMVMSKVLQGINFKYALVFIDDILCHSPDLDSHFVHLSNIFDRLRQANLKLNPKKCQFAAQRVEYLGHILSAKGTEANPEKIKVIRSYPRPKTKRQVRAFLGLCNFYRRYVPNFSVLANPLNQLLKKTSKLKWTDKCDSAFQQLKEKLSSPPVLAFPNINKDFRIAVDASGTGIGYVLSQFDDDGNERVICYGGRSLHPNEIKWSVTDREGLALVEAVKHYHPYLANRHFEVFTDHISLKWLKTIKLARGRLARWSLLLQPYNFTITHKPGVRNQNADALSRRPYETETDSTPAIPDLDDEEIIAQVQVPGLKPRMPDHTSDQEQQIAGSEPATLPKPAIVTLSYLPSVPTLATIQAAQAEDNDNNCPAFSPAIEKETSHTLPILQWQCEDLRPILEYLRDDIVPENQLKARKVIAEADSYVINDNILYHFMTVRNKTVPRPLRQEKQLAVPSALRTDILRAYHDAPGGSHLGFDKTYQSIRLKYYWPKMYSDIHEYIKTCDQCQKATRDYNPKKAPLNPLPTGEFFSRLHMDILGPLTTTKEGFKYILLVVDSCTGWVEGFPLASQDAETIANTLFSQIISRYGAPHSITSDRGANFLSAIVQALCELFSITRHKTSAYHPASNGRVEVMNSVIAKSLRALCAEKQTDWAKHLPGILMGLRLTPNASTKCSPYFMVFGRQMRLPIDCSLIPKDNIPKTVKQYIDEIKENIETSQQIAKVNLAESKEKQKEYHDRKAEIPNYRIGDKVLLKNHKTKKGESQKLTAKYKGPYIIVAYGPHYTYKLKRVSDNIIMPNFWHNDNLKPFHTRKSSVDLRDEDQDLTTAMPPTLTQTVEDRQNQDNVNKPQTRRQPINRRKTSKQPRVLNEDFYVDEILGARMVNGRQQFRIKWQGHSEKTWEPACHLHPNLVSEYNRTHTLAGRKRKKKAPHPKKYFKRA